MRTSYRLLGALLLSITPALVAAPPPGALQWQASALVWRPAPPSLPAGTESTVLEGDPRQPGLFTMRLRVPAGARLAPHTHPRHERVTVLRGSVSVGFGTRFDATQLRTFHAGDYYVNPPDTAHFVTFPEDAEIQITCEGPWGVHYLDPPAAP